MSGEVEFEISDKLEDAYRLSPTMQIFLYLLLLLIVGYVLIYVEIPLEARIGVFIVVAALTFPIIIKKRNVYLNAISLGLYGSAMASIIYLTLINMASLDEYSIALYLLFILIIGVELLHHMGAGLVERTKKSHIAVVVLSVFFFILAYIFLSYYNPIVSFFGALALTFIFAYAILPEEQI